MSHSDELPSANALSALQHHLSGTLSLSPFRTVTRLHYLNLDLKHVCSPPSMLLNCPVRQRLWSRNMALYKFCILLYCICMVLNEESGSLNRVPASAGVRAGMSPLPGGRWHRVIPYGMRVPVAVWQYYIAKCYIRILYTFTLRTPAYHNTCQLSTFYIRS